MQLQTFSKFLLLSDWQIPSKANKEISPMSNYLLLNNSDCIEPGRPPTRLKHAALPETRVGNVLGPGVLTFTRLIITLIPTLN